MVDESSGEAVGVEQPPSLAIEVVAEPVTPENRTNSRHRRRRRRRHHSRSSRTAKYQRSILHFGTAHIVLGIMCVILQMVQFSNNSIFSQAQPGLWCGTFFVITGSICLGLASTKGVYSTLAMLGFCLISLFMALTLASLSWFGAEMAAICQWYWNEYCVDAYPQTTIAPDTTEMIETAAKQEFPKNWLEIPLSKMAAILYSSSNETSENNTCHYESATNTTYACCRDLTYGDCGYDIGLGRTMHSLLVLCGVAGSTTSFILATLACSRPDRADTRNHRRQRFSSIFAISGGDSLPSARPITPWEFPPPSKDPLPVGGEQIPDEPPPPYEYEPNCTSYL